MSKLYPKLQTGRVLPLTETTYTHRPRQDKGYMLQRTVTPYTNNRQIKKSVITPSSPEQVNVISNYYNTSAGQNVNNPEYKYSTNVPLTGEKHWNIDRFIIDPQYSDYKNLGGLPEKAQIRRNILTDIYKQKLLETNNRNQAFRSAKQFVKTEIDPRVNGAYFNTIKGKSGESSTNFGNYNNLITYRQNSNRYGVNENSFKKGAIDYFKTYEKLSNPVAKEKYQKWFEEANIKGMQDSVSYNVGKMNQFSPIPSNSNPNEIYQTGGTLSQLGYKRHSPYNKASSLLIHTPTGSITMKEVDHPILGIGKGEIQIMHPEKEYQFKSNKVLEIPMRSVYPKAQMGTKLPSDNTRVVRNYELPQKFNKQGLRTNLVGKRTGNEIKKDFGKTGTGEIEASVSPLDIAQIGYMGAKVITKAPSLIKSLSKTSQKSSLDWGKWNSEIPFNKPLIKEYSQIEKATKKSGTWMKNPDGSDFEGLPEQFVQQQSSNFKKSFSNPILDEKKNIQISYHGSPNSFDKFDENLSRVGKYGKGVYTTPNKNIAKQYTNKDLYGNKTDNVLELYINSRNPQNLVRNEHIADLDKSFQVLKSKYKGITTSSNPDFKKEFDELMKKQDDLYDNMPESHWYLEDSHDFIRVGDEQVTPYTNLLKSAKNNNGMFDMSNPNIYKAVVPVIISGKVLSDYKNNQMKTTLYPKKFQQGGVAPEMSPEQQQEVVRRVRNLRKTIGYNKVQGVPLDGIAFRHKLHVNKHLIKQEDQELLGAFDENQILDLMNKVPDDDQPTYKKGGSIKGKSKMYPKCKCGCGGVSVGKNKIFQQGGTMDVLDENGNSQMTITGGERIFSRIATKKMLQLNEEGNYKELGKFICDELYLQDKREPQYVKE